MKDPVPESSQTLSLSVILVAGEASKGPLPWWYLHKCKIVRKADHSQLRGCDDGNLLHGKNLDFKT